MNNFIYETPTKVYFGKDEELKVGKIIAEFHPKKVLVHFGGNSARKSGLLDKVENCLREGKHQFCRAWRSSCESGTSACKRRD